ncbi:MAG: extensin family protein [Beijerinckiaceae bacterium]|jgi:hypothetical protein|nr:extensin family protein [Beijerinckiaceae bacterium]
MLRSRHSSLPQAAAIRAPARLGLAILASAAFLSGCGFVRYEQREAWRGEAEVACMKAGIVQESEFVRITKPIDGSGACGLDIPLKVQAFQIDQNILSSFAQAGAPLRTSTGQDFRMTVLKPEATLTCPMVAWLDDWLATAVQPAALAWMGQGVKEIRTGGSYSCRRRNHQPGAKLSEHAFGNAIDIMSFVFADGSVTTVKGGWRGSEMEQGFLREVLNSACGKFRTVLGPGSDAFHHDHFHLDLARHDARGQRRYCRPKVDAPPRPAFPPQFNTQMPPATAYNQAPQQGPQGFPNQAYSAVRPPHGLGQSNPYAASQPPVALTQRPPATSAGSLDWQQQRLQQGNGITPEVTEQEGEFDPRDFDLTSSVSELPTGRGRSVTRQPMPAPTSGLLPSTPRVQNAPSRAPARQTQVRQPSMPMGGN